MVINHDYVGTFVTMKKEEIEIRNWKSLEMVKRMAFEIYYAVCVMCGGFNNILRGEQM